MEFPKRQGWKLCPRRKSLVWGTDRAGRRDEQHQLQIPTAPTSKFSLPSLTTCRTRPRRLRYSLPLDCYDTREDGHFYPHYADKETEARVLLPKSAELIRGRAGTQTKLVTLPSELLTITTPGPASPGCTGKSPGRFPCKLYPQILI